MRRIVIDTTIRDDTDAPSALTVAYTWVARLWWPMLLVTVLASSIHYKDDGDPTWRFRSGWDVLAFGGIVAALTLEARAAVVWVLRRRCR